MSLKLFAENRSSRRTVKWIDGNYYGCSNIQTTFTTIRWGYLRSRTTHIGRCVNLSIAKMKYLRFYPSLVKQCYCTTQRPPFVSILSCSHVLGTTTIHGALLSCGSFFALHIFCVARFLPVRSATFGTALLRVEGSFLGKC